MNRKTTNQDRMMMATLFAASMTSGRMVIAKVELADRAVELANALCDRLDREPDRPQEVEDNKRYNSNSVY